MKQIIIAVLIIGAIIGGAVVFGKEDSVKGEATSYIYGNSDSEVKLIEFGDFECPACKFYYPLIEQVKEKYKDKISFQFAHFPLVQIHQNALAAHRAAEAAGNQGKFWEMYSRLYENQEDWNGPSSVDSVGLQTSQAIAVFEKYAEVIGLDMEQYRADVSAEATLAAINADIARGKNEFGASGTPTIILNGKKIDDLTTVNSLDKFSAILDEALGIEPTSQESSTETPAEETTEAPTPESETTSGQ